MCWSSLRIYIFNVWHESRYFFSLYWKTLSNFWQKIQSPFFCEIPLHYKCDSFFLLFLDRFTSVIHSYPCSHPTFTPPSSLFLLLFVSIVSLWHTFSGIPVKCPRVSSSSLLLVLVGCCLSLWTFVTTSLASSTLTSRRSLVKNFRK